MKQTLKFIGGVLLAAIIITVFQTVTKRVCNEVMPTVVNDTITVTTYDTIAVYKPVPRDSIVLRFETVRLPIVGNKDTVFIPEKGNIDTENISGSANVVIPISQVEIVDSLYHIWASGYKVGIDSVYVYPRTITNTITKAITAKPKRWHIGVSAGYGYTPQGFKPYVGVGLSYSIISF